MGLVDDHEVPIRLADPRNEVLAPSDLVDPTDQFIAFCKYVAKDRAIDEVLSDDLKAKSEPFQQFVLPLSCETPRNHDEDPLGVPPDD